MILFLKYIEINGYAPKMLKLNEKGEIYESEEILPREL